jgi:hypothetical protein
MKSILLTLIAALLLSGGCVHYQPKPHNTMWDFVIGVPALLLSPISGAAWLAVDMATDFYVPVVEEQDESDPRGFYP